MTRIYFLLFLSFICLPAQAHKPSDSYLLINVEQRSTNGQWDIALRDLDYALGLDENGDAAITWGELQAQQNTIFAYALNHLQIQNADSDCPLKPARLMVNEHSDGRYAVIEFQAFCPTPIEQISVSYNLFFELDAQHRGLLTLSDANFHASGIFSPEHKTQQFNLASPGTAWTALFDFARDGVGHIWMGYDHILFLISLLLPAGLVFEKAEWRRKLTLSAVLKDVLAVVTAFTLAHSITLSLTALQYLVLPSRWVESAIAASVAAAALNNIFPFCQSKRAWIAFGFGLIHGMGMAGVLLDGGGVKSIVSLIGFNTGVEAGQLAIVCLTLPAIAWFSRYQRYPLLVMKCGSVGIAAVAVIWLAERSLAVQIGFF
jgi:hypothetical protein